MARFNSAHLGFILGLACCALGAAAGEVTLEELQGAPNLTPKRFAKYFNDFKYEYHEEVQPPRIFFFTQAGDCDDCYVGEEKGYLDYNNRAYFFRIERSGSTLRQIADKVAKSFEANWTTAYEFLYLGNSRKEMVGTVAKTDPETREAHPKRSNPIRVDF
jgi:hypothetical protein